MKIVDANVVLRYLLDDDKIFSDKAADILESESVLLLIEVACEIVYVLQKVYKVDRKKILETFTELFDDNHVTMEKKEIFTGALKLYAEKKLDIVDCILLTYNHKENHQVFTFDKMLLGLLYHFPSN